MQLNQYAHSTNTKLNTENTTNNNDCFTDVTNLGLHNKDFILVTQASIFSYILL